MIPNALATDQPMNPADAMLDQEIQIEVEMSNGTTKAKNLLPEGYRSPAAQQKLVSQVRAAVLASIKVKAGLQRRWRTIDRMWKNELVPTRRPDKDAPVYPVNVCKPRLTKRAALIVQTLTAGDTFFEFKKIGDQKASAEVNQLVEWHLEVTRHDSWIRNWVKDALKYGVSHLRVQYVTDQQQHDATIVGPYSGPEFDVIGPADFHIWPATSKGIRAAKYVGHRLEMLMSEVKAKQKAGEFLAGTLVPHKENDKDSVAPIQQDTEAGYGDHFLDEPITLYDGLLTSYEKGQREVFRIVCDTNSGYVALLHKYDLGEPWYVALHSEQETGVHWPSGSPGHDQQAPQKVVTQLVNEFLWGIAARSRRAHAIAGMSGQELANYKPNELIPIPAEAKVFPLGGDFDPTGYDILLQFFMSQADAVGSTSDTITGAPSAPGDRTATEQNIKFQGFQLGGEDDVRAMSSGFITLGKVLLQTLAAYPEIWGQAYPTAFTIQDPNILLEPWIIELANMSPEDSPSMQGQQAQALVQMLGSLAQVQAVQIIILPLIKTIIRGTSLPEAEELIAQIEAYEQQQKAAAQEKTEIENVISEFLSGNENVTIDDLLALIQNMQGGKPQPEEAVAA